MLGDHGPDGSRGPLAVIPGALARTNDRYLQPWEEGRAEGGGGESRLNLLEYLRIAFKHKWVILVCILAALAAGVAVTLLTRPIYTAAATLQIDRETAKVVDMKDVEPNDQFAQSEEFFQTQYALLKSRSLAERVAQSSGLASNDAFLVAMGAIRKPAAESGSTGSYQSRQRAVAGLLQAGLGVLPVRESRLVRITFDSPSPQLSAQIANAFADNFIAANLEHKYDASAYARQFLEQHLAQVKAKLEDSERQLVAYATQKQIISVSEPAPAGAGGQTTPSQSLAATNLGAFDSNLTAAKANLIQTEQRWRAAQAAQGMSAPDILSDPTVQTLRQERAKLLSQYQDQLKTYKPDYPDMINLKGQIDETTKQLDQAVDTIRGSLKTQYETALRQEQALGSKVNQLKGSVLDQRVQEIQYNILQREVDTNRSLYDGLLQRYKEIGVAGGLSTNNISVVDRALPPGGPSKPKPMHNLEIAGFAGVGLAAALVFMLEMLDQVVRRPSDVESRLGVPVLGTVPLLAKGVQPMEALSDVRSPFSEAYHSIRSTLMFSTKDGAPKVLAMTSAKPEEGKSTSAVALAQGFARTGLKVLLLDLDLRNPSIHKLLGLDNRVGMSNLLTGSVDRAGLAQATVWPNLFVVPSGPIPPSPAELLAGPRLKSLLTEAAQEFDIVVIDAPPVVGLADAPLIASVATGCLIAVEVGHTTRANVQAAVRRLQMANGHILGAILTKFDARKSTYGYGYTYSYEYDYKYGSKPAKAGADQQLGDRGVKISPPAA